MRFSAKAVLSGYSKSDGKQMVYLQAIINRRPVRLSLGFSLDPQHFDPLRGVVKPGCENSDLMNHEITTAVNRAQKIHLQYKFEDRYLTVEDFKNEFMNPMLRRDFIQFMQGELELRKPKMEKTTTQTHEAALSKLRAFRPSLSFAELTVDFVQKFENYLRKKGLQQNTIVQVFKKIKVYVHIALQKGIKFKDPFEGYHLPELPPSKPALSFSEVQKLFEYRAKADTPANHKRLLGYFLFSCTTGLRISDISKIQWNNIHDDVLRFVPYKTRKNNKEVSVPLIGVHQMLMPPIGRSKFIFDCYCDQVTNRLLKDIGEACGIKKHLTYHISRHTFATEFLNNSGQLDTLQQLLGHSMITTTMQYVKVSDEKKRKQLQQAFDSLHHSTKVL